MDLPPLVQPTADCTSKVPLSASAPALEGLGASSHTLQRHNLHLMEALQSIRKQLHAACGRAEVAERQLTELRKRAHESETRNRMTRRKLDDAFARRSHAEAALAACEDEAAELRRQVRELSSPQSVVRAIERASLGGAAAFGEVIEAAVATALKCQLPADEINRVLAAESVPVHEEPDLSKLGPALRAFETLADADAVRATMHSAAVEERQRQLEAAPDDADAIAAFGAAHLALRRTYEETIAERLQKPGLFRLAATAVVEGGDSFSNVYSSVWKLIDKPGVTRAQDVQGEGVFEYRDAVAECLEADGGTLLTASVKQPRMRDERDVAEYMSKNAKVLPPFGRVVAAIVAATERKHGFRAVSCVKPKHLKKVKRIAEKVALRPERDRCVASVCDCVRMMVPVHKMRHVAWLLRAFCDDALVSDIARQHGARRLRVVRAKERFYRSPSAGGWRDLMLNLEVEVAGVVVIAELQVPHSTMLNARSGLPGHLIYNRVRRRRHRVCARRCARPLGPSVLMCDACALAGAQRLRAGRVLHGHPARRRRAALGGAARGARRSVGGRRRLPDGAQRDGVRRGEAEGAPRRRWRPRGDRARAGRAPECGARRAVRGAARRGVARPQVAATRCAQAECRGCGQGVGRGGWRRGWAQLVQGWRGGELCVRRADVS